MAGSFSDFHVLVVHRHSDIRMRIASLFRDRIRLVNALLPHRSHGVDDFTVAEARMSATCTKDDVVNGKNPNQLAGFINDRQTADLLCGHRSQSVPHIVVWAATDASG